MKDTERLDLPSASNNAFWCCPGQNNLMREAGYPDSESNPDSDRGTKIHTAFETGNTLELDEEQEETFKQGMIFLEALLADWLATVSTSQWKEGPREERMWIRGAALEPLASAKLDRHYIAGEDGYCIDFKSGFVPNLAPSPRSTQLRIQALAFRSEHPELRRIRVAFCKAKLRYGAEDYCDYSESDLVHAEQWMQQHLWLAKQPDAPRTPGSHCTYCPVKSWCREAASYSLLPTVIASRAIQKPEFDPVEAVAKMTEPDLVKVWQSSTLITGILAAVKQRLKSMPDESLTALGITRGKGKELHNITAVRDAFIHLERVENLTEDEIYACMDFSNTKLAKILRTNKGLPSDKAASLFLKQQLAPFITVQTTEAALKEINE